MKSFLDLPVRSKLLTVLGAIVLLFGIAMYVGYRTTVELLSVQEDVRAKQQNAAKLARVLANHNEARLATVMVVAGTDKADQQSWLERIRGSNGDNTAILTELERRNENYPAFLQALRHHNEIREELVTARGRSLELAMAGDTATARKIAFGENSQRYARMRDIINELIATADVHTNSAVRDAQAVANRAQRSFILLGVGVVAISLGALIALSRMISSPLQELVLVAKEVSRGNLRVTMPAVSRQDEVGELAQAFGSMVDSLRTVQREIQEGVGILASSASEIFTATAQIAASATETATAVSQTTSTAEEVKQTAQLAAQKAGNVADIAQRAAQSAQAGRKAIDESIAGMSHVRDQMELIAETVVRLSEQTQAIGEIIASVNDLAEQSNLLAVNASIEAAKAGEQGKGFAVVAHEIRNLANQSRESTAQVRNLLNEIQRATTATVMAAEQGSKAVDGGVKQVNQSGDAIRTLAESIVAAAQAATQITASAQEQLVGIDQVTIAIQNILQASRQNASGTQQAESGARNLSQLGQTLKAAVAKFSV